MFVFKRKVSMSFRNKEIEQVAIFLKGFFGKLLFKRLSLHSDSENCVTIHLNQKGRVAQGIEQLPSKQSVARSIRAAVTVK